MGIRMTGRLENEDGLSLIETVLALGVLAIGLLAVFTLHYAAARNNTAGNLSTQAQMLATNVIEELKGQDILDPDSRINSAATFLLTDVDENFNTPGPFDVNIRVDDSLGLLVRRLEVSISWSERGEPRSVAYTTLTRGMGE